MRGWSISGTDLPLLPPPPAATVDMLFFCNFKLHSPRRDLPGCQLLFTLAANDAMINCKGCGSTA